MGRKGKPQNGNKQTKMTAKANSGQTEKPNMHTLAGAGALHTEWSPERRETIQINPGRLSSSSVALEKGFSNAFEPRTFLLGPSAASRKEKGESCLRQRPGVLGWPVSLGCGHLLSSQFGAAAAALGCFFPMVQNWFDFS